MLFAAAGTIHVGQFLMGLLGGLALFLLGMQLMTDSLKAVAGGGMKVLLNKLTTNRFTAALSGAAVTAVIQSSSVTTVLVVGFISAGLLSLTQSIGVIMGANIGTTITAQVIAFKVTKYALAMIAAGFALQFFIRRERAEHCGLFLLGLGLIFLGMDVMSDATGPLKTYPPFIELIEHTQFPLLAILISALFTAVVQSSSATTGIVIVLAAQGFITLEAGIAMAFGANIGTCVTALLATIRKPRAAVQAALVHVLFNLAGVAMFYPLIGPLATLVREISPSAEHLAGAARLAAETPRQIANAHTLFNVGSTLVFIWFAGPLARLLQWLLPEKAEGPRRVRPKYLDPVYLGTPALALDSLRMELGHMGERAMIMFRAAPPIVLQGTSEDAERLEDMDEDVDRLHKAILDYAAQLSREEMNRPQGLDLQDYVLVANKLEAIADTVATNLVESARHRLDGRFTVPDDIQEGLNRLWTKVTWCVERSLAAVNSRDPLLSQQVVEANPEVSRLVSEARRRLADRMAAAPTFDVALFRYVSDVIEALRHVYKLARRASRRMVDVDLPAAEGSSKP